LHLHDRRGRRVLGALREIVVEMMKDEMMKDVQKKDAQLKVCQKMTRDVKRGDR
jgi:hypothetical protein